MTDAILGGLLLNFSAVVGVKTALAGRANWSSITYSVAGFLISIGTVAGFAAIALFIKDQGVVHGLLYWALSGFVLSFVVTLLMDGFRSILGLVSLAVGVYFAIRVFT